MRDENLGWVMSLGACCAALFGIGFYVGFSVRPLNGADIHMPPDINIHIPDSASIDGPLVRLSGGCEPGRVVLEGGTFNMNGGNGPAIEMKPAAGPVE